MPDVIPQITLKAARVNAGLGQREAAKRIGISISTLRNYEWGKTAPDVLLLQRIGEVYRFPPNSIFFARNRTNSV